VWVRVPGSLGLLQRAGLAHADVDIVPFNLSEASLPDTPKAMKSAGSSGGSFAGRRVFRCAGTSSKRSVDDVIGGMEPSLRHYGA
jgi:hypothetical protein